MFGKYGRGVAACMYFYVSMYFYVYIMYCIQYIMVNTVKRFLARSGTGHKVEGGVGYEKLGVGHYFSTCRKGWVRKIYALH